MVKIHLLTFICFGIRIATAQSSFTLFGSRAAGMGYASAVLTDEWSLFNNIGGLGKVNQANAGFAYEVRPALIGANRIAASLSSPTKIGTLGLGIFKFGDDVYSEHIVSAGFGNQVGNTSLGAKVNYTQYRAEGFGMNTAMSVDFGGITTITPQISVGAYIINLTQSKLMGTDGERLPTRLVVGIGLKPSEKLFISSELEKDLAYQATWRSGLEYSVYKKIFFRTGFNVNPDAAYFGLGAQKKNLKFDYAVRFSQLLGSSHQASAVYLLSTKKKKK